MKSLLAPLLFLGIGAMVLGAICHGDGPAPAAAGKVNASVSAVQAKPAVIVSVAPPTEKASPAPAVVAAVPVQPAALKTAPDAPAVVASAPVPVTDAASSPATAAPPVASPETNADAQSQKDSDEAERQVLAQYAEAEKMVDAKIAAETAGADSNSGDINANSGDILRAPADPNHYTMQDLASSLHTLAPADDPNHHSMAEIF
jgi:hypothetical protein